MFRRRRPFGLYIISIILVFAVFFSAWLMELRIKPVLFEMARIRAVQMGTEAVNQAVRSKVAELAPRYQDLVQVTRDGQGKVVLMQADMVRINAIQTETTLAAQAALMRLPSQSISIPLGQVTGVTYLAGIGPRVSVVVIPEGTVRSSLEDRFDSAGINQARHRIYIDFDTDVEIVIPLKSGRAKVATRMMLAESIIVGEVPSTYVSVPGLFSLQP